MLVQGSKLLVVDFWADWCAPCHAMSAAVNQLAAEEAEAVTVVTVDTVEHPQLSERFAVRSLPTLLVFRDGELVHRTTGVKRLPQLRRLIAEHGAAS